MPAAAIGGPDTLPGTEPLANADNLDVRLMDGAHLYVERKIAESVQTRQRFWKRDLSSRQAYEKSVEPNRARFRKITGIDNSCH